MAYSVVPGPEPRPGAPPTGAAVNRLAARGGVVIVARVVASEQLDALAIVAAGALLWYGARPEVLGQLAGQRELDQLLTRALVYRLVTEIVMRKGTPGIDAAARAGQPVTDLVLARLTH